ncbi:hypothetical protein ASF32_22575 [Methylobacterium sp. Leaf91]|nr:hypothetical protein ASF32_22575 [Methylobacterium sp. Leaf91]
MLDAVGTHVSYTYWENEPIRRQSVKRVTRDEAVQMAKMIARALTVEFGEREPRSGYPSKWQMIPASWIL